MPAVGEPGYLPYCGACTRLVRMERKEDLQAFVCPCCGLRTRRVNGQDMFDQTAPAAAVQAGDMDGGVPNRFDPSKRGFQP